MPDARRSRAQTLAGMPAVFLSFAHTRWNGTSVYGLPVRSHTMTGPILIAFGQCASSSMTVQRVRDERDNCRLDDPRRIRGGSSRLPASSAFFWPG